ncbi:MAG TPA: DUF481 domain-containing protein [Polyangiaceae bacterium]|nr:DUF481 domain-containing protein [Polyangiaceae bacterium]
MISLLALGAGISLSPDALAQEAPKGLMGAKTATQGKEDVAVSGFAAPVGKLEESKDTTELKISLGGLFASGNSKSIAANGTTKLHVRRDDNQLDAAFAANYGRAAVQGETAMRPTVENFQGRMRYDRFVASNVALFLSMSALKDRFQGLDLRLNLDPGLAYYFLDVAKHRFWAEGGYDLQSDFRRESAINDALAKGEVLDRSEVRHNLRLFLGYENALNKQLTFDTGVEYLQALKETKNYRINWNAGLTSQVSGNFSIATTLNLRYDHNPLPNIKNTDVVTAISLVYQLL